MRAIQRDERDKDDKTKVIDDKFYVQEDTSVHTKQTGKVSDIKYSTLCEFDGIIYKGPHAFDTLEEAKEKIKEIENGLEVHYMPNKSDSKLESLWVIK